MRFTSSAFYCDQRDIRGSPRGEIERAVAHLPSAVVLPVEERWTLEEFGPCRECSESNICISRVIDKAAR